VKAYLFDHKDHFFEPGDDALHYTIFLEEDQTFIGMVQTVGIARHPFQIYEAIVFLILLVVFLRSNWIKNAPYASGLMLVLFSALHFGLDFLREAQNLKWLPLHAEQLMLVPVVVLGILLLVKKEVSQRNSALFNKSYNKTVKTKFLMWIVLVF